MKNTLCVSFLVLLSLTGCYTMRKSNGGGQVDRVAERKAIPADILLSPGYAVELVATGLNLPTALAFDDEGILYVVEGGYSYGEVWATPKLIRVGADGSKAVVAEGTQNGPWTGVAFHDGNFYISEGGQAKGGKILRVSRSGDIRTLVDDLPSVGDHHTNGLVIKDTYIYFGQGTATNSAVVGPDNAAFGWLKRKNDFHDIPCKDVVLSGENYKSYNALTENEEDEVITGAYSPYGTSTSAGQVIAGSVPCNGAILRIPVDGGTIEVVSWGLRNPFGIAVSPDGKLYTTENGFDARGSRPVWGVGDVLWEVKEDMWYGWPDFAEGIRVANNPAFEPPSSEEVRPLMQTYPNKPPTPVAVFGVHSSANGFDFSRSERFGFKGEAFVAQFGDMAPNVGKVLAPVGFKVVRVNVNTGVIRDFAVNKGKKHGPASWLGSGGLERPIAAKFSPDGEALYIVDFGILRMTAGGAAPRENTGVIWRIKKQ